MVTVAMRFDEVLPDVFLCKGQSRLLPGLAMSKTMTIVRSGSELTVINSAKLDDVGERALRALGTVKHLVRLGASHGLDDAWFIERFQPTTWAPERVRARASGAAQQHIVEGGALPIDARAFVFAHGREGEAALLVRDLLVTCDSLQAWRTTVGCSFLGGAMLKRMGLLAHPVVIGPLWLKHQSGGVRGKIRPDFARLQALDFTQLVGAHGDVLRDAKQPVRSAIVRAFA